MGGDPIDCVLGVSKTRNNIKLVCEIFCGPLDWGQIIFATESLHPQF